MLNQLNLFYYFYETDIVKNVGALDTYTDSDSDSSSATAYQHIVEID